MTKYYNPDTKQIATHVKVDHETGRVTYEVDGKQCEEDWVDFIAEFRGLVNE